MLMYVGHATLGVIVLVVDKVVVTALFARIWQLTEPAVTKIESVRRMRDGFLRLRRVLHAWLECQPAYLEARSIIRRQLAGMRRRRSAARRIHRRRDARTQSSGHARPLGRRREPRNQPRPMKGIFVAITVRNWTLASSGRLAM